MEMDDECVLAKILVQENKAGIKVGDLIALTVEDGEDWKDVAIPAAPAPAAKAATSEASGQAATPAAAPSAPAAASAAAAHEFEHIPNVGPATALLMAQYGIKSSQLTASGPKGLTKADVLAHIANNGLKAIKIDPSAAALGAAAAPAAATRKQRKPT